MKSNAWTHSHLLDLERISSQDLRLLLSETREMEKIATSSRSKSDVLRGKVVVNLFFEDSTRTRASFRLAAQRLGADVLDMSASGSSVSKGETLLDTARNIEAMGVDAIVLRHQCSGAPLALSRQLNCSVLNAGDGAHEHPTQGLLDIYALATRLGREDFDLSGLRVAVVGDIAHSRVARSNLYGLRTLGAEVVLVGPPTLLPATLAGHGVSVSQNLDEVIAQGIDAINMLRVQFERISGPSFPSAREYQALFCLTPERLAKAGKNTVVMHPGPMNRGLEIKSEVADGPQSVILEQVTHGVAVRMAALKMCIQAAEASR